MTFRGHVQSGVVVFDGPQTPPEGTTVEVAVLTTVEKSPLRDLLLEFAGTIDGLPSDMAAQHRSLSSTDVPSDDSVVRRYVLFHRPIESRR